MVWSHSGRFEFYVCHDFFFFSIHFVSVMSNWAGMKIFANFCIENLRWREQGWVVNKSVNQIRLPWKVTSSVHLINQGGSMSANSEQFSSYIIIISDLSYRTPFFSISGKLSHNSLPSPPSLDRAEEVNTVWQSAYLCGKGVCLYG